MDTEQESVQRAKCVILLQTGDVTAEYGAQDSKSTLTTWKASRKVPLERSKLRHPCCPGEGPKCQHGCHSVTLLLAGASSKQLRGRREADLAKSEAFTGSEAQQCSNEAWFGSGLAWAAELGVVSSAVPWEGALWVPGVAESPGQALPPLAWCPSLSCGSAGFCRSLQAPGMG